MLIFGDERRELLRDEIYPEKLFKPKTIKKFMYKCIFFILFFHTINNLQILITVGVVV